MKPGIDFFPLDVDLDEKWELIEAEFGLKGFSVVVKLLQRIYGGQGYYCEFTNEVALLFAKRLGLGGSVVSQIVSAAVNRGIFDKTLYEKYEILTSGGIQKRYFEAVSRRKSVKVDPRYLLVPYAQKSSDDNKNEENVDIFSKNVDNFKQSKVKESKVNITLQQQTDTHAREGEIEPRPNALDISAYFQLYGFTDEREIDRFIAYNNKREWDCLPDWKKAARQWMRQIPRPAITNPKYKGE